jgi:hypothetical protein
MNATERNNHQSLDSIARPTKSTTSMIASAGTFTTSHPITIALKTPKVALDGVSFAFGM